MPNTALVIDEHALGILGSAMIESEWFSNFSVPNGTEEIRSVHLEGCRYLLSKKADENSRLLIAKIGSGGVFEGCHDERYIFDRMCHIALASFGNTVSIPVTWKPYHEGPLLSVYAFPGAKGKGERLHFDRAPFDTRHIYAYAVTPTTEQFNDVPVEKLCFKNALASYIDALLTSPEEEQDREAGAIGITLSEPLGYALLGKASLDEWYESKLTKQQRDFVDSDHSGPVRLKGSAGTGKTLSLVVKCLRDLYALDEEGAKVRVAFITHSSSLAHEVVTNMFYTLDPTERWKNLDNCSLWIGSLYELAQKILQYERKELEPLSTDGREGKELQFLLIGDAIEKCLKNSKFINEYIAKCDPNFAETVKSREWRSQFIYELINEFSSYIDAKGIRKGMKNANDYIHGRRENWQLPLPSEYERRVVLEIHDEYCKDLDNSRVLSMDQMIGDFNNYLVTNEWKQLRSRVGNEQGFDIVFVDELHYFNLAERMTFHNMFISRSVSEDGRSPLFMAYDLKQSPTDAFLGQSRLEDAGSMFRSVGAGKTELVELTTVFRSTPEISAFLEGLDAAFPALDFESEWSDYVSDNQQESGEKPKITTFKSNVELLDEVFKLAQREANLLGGMHVAVLCINEQLFDTYVDAGRIRDKITPINSREQVTELSHTGKRCIFSMPEYVAGLQFQSVYLIHLDKAEFADSESIGRRRRFVSHCYLGASRASKRLFIACSDERGGPSDVLASPIASGLLDEV